MDKEENAVVPAMEEDSIQSRILTIRGVQVMLDRDLAELYGVEVKYLNRQVKRNIERFPDDFMFQLNRNECSRCQFVTLNEGRGNNIKYLPYVFTENGVAMLSGVLRSSRAISANIQIMRSDLISVIVPELEDILMSTKEMLDENGFTVIGVVDFLLKLE